MLLQIIDETVQYITAFLYRGSKAFETLRHNIGESVKYAFQFTLSHFQDSLASQVHSLLQHNKGSVHFVRLQFLNVKFLQSRPSPSLFPKLAHIVTFFSASLLAQPPPWVLAEIPHALLLIAAAQDCKRLTHPASTQGERPPKNMRE